MNKKVIGLVVSGLLLSAQAQAGTLTFDQSTAGSTGSIVFDGLDLSTSVGTVTQTDTDASGDVTGSDSFVELGDTISVNWLLGTGIVPSTLGTDYEIWLDYSLNGEAEGLPGNFGGLDIGVDFATGMGTLYIDSVVDGIMDTSTSLGSLTYKNSQDIDCIVNGGVNNDGEFIVNTGGCNFNWDFVATAGFFDYDGEDLATVGQTAPVRINMDVTVEAFDGLFFSYAAQEQYLADNGMASDGADQQVFGIEHDANVSFSVPEPTTLASLGLGLLAMGFGARRKSKK